MDQVWEDKIRAYRESIKQEKPDLDFALLLRILDIVNESSEVKVAIDPIAESGEWSSDAPTYTVKDVTRLDDGRISLVAGGDKHGIEAGTLYNKIKKALKRASGEKVPVLFQRGETVIQLTDAYSHALVREQWAGMPFDLVLAIRE